MPRYSFGGGSADYVADTNNRLLPNRIVRFYSAEVGGVQYTDLLVGGVAASSVTSVAAGRVPTPLQGPNDVKEMWADAGFGRSRMDAYDDEVATELAAADARAAAAEATAAAELAVAPADAAVDAGIDRAEIDGRLVTPESLRQQYVALDADGDLSVNEVKVTAAALPSGPAAYPTSLPASVALLGVYEDTNHSYNVKRANTRNIRGVLAAKVRPARLSVIGNSIVFGSVTSPAHLNGFVSRLRTKLDAIYGPAGTGIVYPIDTTLTDDTRIVESAGWSAFNRGAFNVGCRLSSTAGSTWTFGPVTADSFTFYLLAGGGSTLTLTIDNGTPESFTIANLGEAFTSITKNAGTLGSHSVKLTVSSGNVFIVGVEGSIAGNGRVKVNRAGRGGTYLGDPNAASNPDAPGAVAATNSYSTLFNLTAPDLTVCFFETNEYLQQVSLTAYRTALDTFITRAKATGDVILCTTVPPQNTALAIPLSSYAKVLYEAADAADVPLFDVTDDYVSYTVSNAAPFTYYGDGNHPNNTGHERIAVLLSRVLDVIAA